MNYYQIQFRDEKDYEPYGVGYVVDGNERIFLPYEGEVTDWSPLKFMLRDGDYCDYLSTNSVHRVCSERLRNILDDHCGQKDELQWLPLSVHLGNEAKAYYALHFPNPADVLDIEKTMWVNGTDLVIKPVFSSDKLSGHSVFSFPKDESLPLFVDTSAKIAIEDAGCTGLQFTIAKAT